MKKVFALLALAALLTLPLAANAMKYDGHFGDMDKDHDGAVVWEEFVGFFPDASEEDFILIAGEDKAMDHDEWHRYKDAHGLRDHGAGEKKGHAE